MQIPLMGFICTILTQIQQSFVFQTPSTNSKPSLNHFWRPTTAGKLPHSTRIGRENVAKFIKFCKFSSERKKIAQFLASTSNYQLELVIGTYPTFSEQRIWSSDSEKSTKTTKINFLLQNLQALWEKKTKFGIFWILLPIFRQLHEDIMKLFIVRIFSSLVLKRIPN